MGERKKLSLVWRFVILFLLLLAIIASCDMLFVAMTR